MDMRFILPLIGILSLTLLPLLVWWVVHVVSWAFHFVSPQAGRVLEWVARGLGATVLLLMVAGHTWGPRHLVVRHVEYSSPLVPKGFDGYRIAQFTDLHLASQAHQRGMVKKLVDTLLAQHADMICFTGDLVTLSHDEIDGHETQLSRLTAPDGVYSVLGNHDYHIYTHLGRREQERLVEEMKQRERSLGWDLLLNGHRIIARGGDTLCLGGVENDGNRRHFPQLGDLPKTFAGTDSIAFKVLLSHDPTHWRRKVLPDTDVALTLSGHTHGMQFKLFGWSPSQWIYPEWCGLYAEGARALHVSTGVGGAGLPFRLGAWPEITVITLRHSEWPKP